MASKAVVDENAATMITDKRMIFPKPIPLNENATVVELKMTFPLESKNNTRV